MIRTNLSTRPFYNERAIRLWLMVLALAAAAATAFNVTRVLQLSRSDTELSTQASRDEARSTELRAQAASLRSTVDPRQIDIASEEARTANSLIDRRVFSWTELFNRFETTLPDDVRIAAVHPQVDSKTGTVLRINVVAKSVDDVNRFMESLEATGAFAKLISREERVNDQGLLEAALETTYVTSAPAKGTGP